MVVTSVFYEAWLQSNTSGSSSVKFERGPPGQTTGGVPKNTTLNNE